MDVEGDRSEYIVWWFSLRMVVGYCLGEVCERAMLQWVIDKNDVLKCVARRGRVEEKDIKGKSQLNKIVGH